jgi:hypothetical protein
MTQAYQLTERMHRLKDRFAPSALWLPGKGVCLGLLKCDLEILNCLEDVVGELGQDHCDLLLGLHFVEGLKYRLLEVEQVRSFHGGGVLRRMGRRRAFL